MAGAGAGGGGGGHAGSNLHNDQDSISGGPSASERRFDDSTSQHAGGAGQNTSGRILGRYFANEKEEEQVLRENVHDVCFWMNADAMNEHPSVTYEFTKNVNQYQGGSMMYKNKTGNRR